MVVVQASKNERERERHTHTHTGSSEDGRRKESLVQRSMTPISPHGQHLVTSNYGRFEV
jgi:hypothetical protein